MTKNNGGPAFPSSATLEPFVHSINFGMTLRDWFAGQALAQAVEDYGEPQIGSSSGQRRDRGNPILPYASKGSGTREFIIARQAYRYADAMLAAREADQ